MSEGPAGCAVATRNGCVAGTGSYVPLRVLTNGDLCEMLGEDIEPFVGGRLGIRERHLAAADESAADLAVEAARKALAKAGAAAEDLDLVIVATDTPEYISPATSSVVQARLGALRAGTFDVNCSCASFVTALDVAAKYIRCDPAYGRVLVVGVYVMSKFLDWRDKRTSTIFADGAGAVLLAATEEPGRGFLASTLHADGTFHDYLGIFGGGTRYPASPGALERGEHLLRFQRRFPDDVNTSQWPRLIRATLAKSGLQVEDVDLVIFTQINRSVIEEVMALLGLPLSKTHMVMQKWGYTGSACIPMALDDAVMEGKLERGDLVVFCGSGVGIAMAVAAFRW